MSDISVADCSASYNRGQSLRWGSRDGLQFGFYRKDLEIGASDKVDFWKNIWRQACDDDGVCLYQEGEPFWRLAFRYHHSVMAQFSRGSGRRLIDFRDLTKVGTVLFMYSLNAFHLDQGGYVDAF